MRLPGETVEMALQGGKFIGAHVSAAGGVANAPRNAAEIGANAFALFTKNQRQWVAQELTACEIVEFKKACSELDFEAAQILPHDTYLINLGSPKPDGLAKSREAFILEMERCSRLGLKFLNFHPGTHLGLIPVQECLERVAESVNMALERVQGVVAVLENTAGQGSSVGVTLEEIAGIVAGVTDKSRIAVCVDTCHAFAAGYDIRTRAGWASFMDEFDRTVGLEYLSAMHLNDSKNPLGSRVDRHECLGKGHLGIEVFAAIMADHRLDGKPLILETPDPEGWAGEIRMLREMETGVWAG